jgi:hypothetical protein
VFNGQFIYGSAEAVGRKAQKQFDGVPIRQDRLFGYAPEYPQVLTKEALHVAGNQMQPIHEYPPG